MDDMTARENELVGDELLSTARRMMVAARTAPKGKGRDNLIMRLAEAGEIKLISEKTNEIGTRLGLAGFVRDAQNMLSARLMLLFGTGISPMGLKKCGMCGFGDCAGKSVHPEVPCVFNTGDLGIAIGSAVSVAMECRVDNRVMYTAGQAVLELGLMGPEVKIVYAVPLSVSGKNPFFDRAG